MKLSYSIPGKIWWITNFLGNEMYKGIHNAIIKERNNINLQSVKGLWGEELINNLVPPMRTGVSNYKPFESLKALVKYNPYFQLPDLKHMTTTIHYMKKNTGINWHDDGKWKFGATYYLNHKWHKQWGGEFMFTDNNGHGWIPPVGNSLIIVKAPIPHKVNPVLSPIIPRISVQLFMK
jgi:hypothetical protein|tara:strand:+ start:442 stop:975 length:534 start_codon:yes stop_codon:yes gene_type:complete